MKNFKAPILAVLSVLFVVSFGCKKDSKDNDRDKFLGTYSVVENCPTTGTGNYDITITESAASSSSVIISNFGDFTVGITATVSGNSITIPQQTITVQGFAIGINGSGSINGLIMTITYSYSVGGQGENCTMTCTKK